MSESTGSSSRVITSSPLSSNAIGTATNDLIAKCEVITPLAADPPASPRAPAVALAFSGGGFRATLTALGTLRFVADAGLLSQVRYVSSVSGGSVANGLFACRYEELERAGLDAAALDRLVIRPFVQRITEDSLATKLITNLWRILGRGTRTDLLAREFDTWFFGERLLDSLSPKCRWIFNAASLTTGVRFGFERDFLGDWVMGRASTAGTGIRVAQAVAASAAVPGAFAPYAIRGVKFPCARGRTQKLVDGGAYDNSAMEAVDDLPDVLLVAVNAGGLFRTGGYGGIPIVRDLQRSNSLLYRQSTGLRRREMVDRFKAWEEAKRLGQPIPPWGRQGALFGLATSFTPSPEWSDTRPEHAEWTDELANYKTSFAKFPAEICRRLLYRGWWLTGATLATYHRSVLVDLPSWQEQLDA